MKTVYKRFVWCCCVLFAVMCIGSVSAVTAFADGGKAAQAAQVQVEGHSGSARQMFGSMGAGAVIVIATICLLADKKKK
ncbi:MAG: hypothetical protein J5582_05905 [Ruminococcus sp.]|uniref:hypothetical protein n=1 Tax=Ruminococcus sp. TaxID=41978 RepID=UPI0025F58A34|nr:hypothetical protein [Ruminococcus sp.]MBO4866090.1 hypothetical protein [Ruminococcus sp.]